MKLETFFEKFDQFADAPDAVAKMRELIMWSAFSGAFSAEERDQPMPEEWVVESAPTLPAIPSSWKWQRGSDVFDVIRGVSYKKNDASDSPVEGSFPVLRANNIGNGINFDGLVYVPRDNIRDEQFVRRGDILLAMSSGSKKLVGKAAPIVSDFVGSFGAFCGIIRNKSAIPDEVLARYFQSPQYTSWVTAAGRGIGINNLGKGDLDSLPVPTPPLAEQKRIVAKVDELMALCDRLEAQQQEREERHAALARASLARFADAPTPTNLEFLFHKSYDIQPAELRKSILTLAVQGKLVPQDPNDEPAEVSIERVSKDAKQAIRDGIIRRHGLEETADDSGLSELPFGWRWTRLVEVTRPVPYAIKRGPFGSAIRKDMFVPTGFKVYEQQHAIYGDFTVGRYYITQTKFDELSAFELHPGEILVSCSGTVGKVAIVPAAIERGIINQALLKLSLHQAALLNEYFLILFPAFFMETDTLTNLSGTAQKNIPGMDVLKAMPFPLPPLAEQRRIVAKVEQLMALVDALEQQLATSRDTAANLLSALVAEITAHKGARYET